MLDLFIVIAFVLYGIGAGLAARRKASANLDEYFLAGRSVSGWKAGLSMAATQFAADTPLLVTGLVATAGIFALWRLWIYGLAFLAMAFLFGVMWRRSGVLTDAELTTLRYSGRGVLGVRVLKAFYYGTVINCAVMAMVLLAAVRIAEVVLPWHAWLPEGVYTPLVTLVTATGLDTGESITGLAREVATTNNAISIILVVLFTALYSTTGGMRAVVNTDVVQFALAMVGTLVYAWVAVNAAGGLDALPERVATIYGVADAARMLSFAPPLSGGELLAPFLVIVGLQWFFQMNSDGTGYLAQRSMACSSDRDARIAAIVFAWMQVLLRSLLWLAIAVSLLVLYPFTVADAAAEGFAASREVLFVQGIEDLLPAGARGIMLVGLLAALASTVDTHLNWGASYWSNDIYDSLVCRHWLRRTPRPREMVLVARCSGIAILLIALTLMVNLDSIQTAWFLSLLFGAGTGSVLVLRWVWERINLYSELAAIVVSLVTAPLLLWLFGVNAELEWIRLALMALVTTAAVVGITFVTPATEPERLQHFYERVQPVGFWSRTARAAGGDPSRPRRALLRLLGATALSGVSLFCVLFGAGTWLIETPGGSGVPSMLALIAGLALIPFWWRELALADRGGSATS